MPEEDQHLDETEQDSTLGLERESEEAADLDSLFADDEEQEDAPVSREEYNRLLKGTKKLASELGRLKSQPKKEEVKTETKEVISHQDDDLSELFFNQTKEAELVSDDLKAISKATGKSILKVWREEKWLQEKAKALEAAKTEDEVNKGKIGKPTPGSGGNGKIPFSQIDLSKKEHVEYIKNNPKYRDGYNAFLLNGK